MREISLAFGDGPLIGTICLPATPAPRAPGLVMFNAGVVHRIGPHRINVKLARALAARGGASIRFDLRGLGDSAAADGRVPHAAQVVEDLRAAMDALQGLAGTQGFALLGFCSGMMPAIDAARADPRVRALVIHDGFSPPTLRSRALRLAQLWRGRSPRALLASARAFAASARAWIQARATPRAHAAAEAPLAGHAEIVDMLAMLARRGVRVTVLHSGGDFTGVNHARQLRDAMGDAGAAVQCAYLGLLDHVVTSVPAQQLFVDTVLAALRFGDAQGRR